MQKNSELNDKKKVILMALAKTLKQLRGEQSQFMFSSENSIPIDVINKVERGIKDPQFTTVYRIAEACGLSLDEFCKVFQNYLPNDFSIIEK